MVNASRRDLLNSGVCMNRRVGRSLRVRLALFASIAMLLLALVVNTIALISLRDQAIDARAHEVFGKAVPVLLTIRRGQLTEELDVRDLDGVQVVDPAGRVTAATPNLSGLPRLTTAIPLPGQANGVAELCDLPGLPECHVVIAMSVYQPDGTWLIYALAQNVPWYVSPEVLAFLLGMTAALIMLTWFGVSRVVAETLAPVDRIPGTWPRSPRTAAACAWRCRAPGRRDPRPWPRPPTRRWSGWKPRWRRGCGDGAAAQVRRRRLARPAQPASPRCAPRSRRPCSTPSDADWPRDRRALLASLDRLQAIVTDLLTLAKLDAGAPAAGARGPGRAGRHRDRQAPLKLMVITLQIRRDRHGRPAQTGPPADEPAGQRRAARGVADRGDRAAQTTRPCWKCSTTARASRPTNGKRCSSASPGWTPHATATPGAPGSAWPSPARSRRRHGGTLTIEDSDRGARFVLRLPPAER